MTIQEKLIEAAVQYAIEGTKALILINGGAAAGLATFLSADSRTHVVLESLICAMQSFAFGALSATLTFGLSYIAQIYAYEMNAVQGSRAAKIFNRWRISDLGCAILSSVLFVVGIFFVGEAVK